MNQAITDIVYQLGYPALYLLMLVGIVGLPVPGETLMAFAGSLTLSGSPFTFVGLLLVLVAGSMTGMIISYILGYRVGKPFLYRYGKWIKLTPVRIDRAERWFKRYGLWAVLFGFFLPGVRHFTCYFAGVSGVGFVKYLVYSAVGAVLWCGTFLTLGHYIGTHFNKLYEMIHHYLGVSILVLVLAALVAVSIYLRSRKRTAL
ncbi:DedA family protein [Paenibacillus eucommiae]|uniref:Membrane protein DedA with SNARE-associated domain n=1 Tax=Paenibacillus eucommiae TaxID=1355755 RepID=A0ABS4INS7_9BACL|nr:DedA family protein [Paenibacillus eucommiae]MBP1989208.1 membrane protein DedA with SNARE-associated domain [Paenibacillus eucommiae]